MTKDKWKNCVISQKRRSAKARAGAASERIREVYSFSFFFPIYAFLKLSVYLNTATSYERG